MAKRGTTGAVVLLLVVAVVVVGLRGSPSIAEGTSVRGFQAADVPLVWRDPGQTPPKFWLCSVGLDPGSGGQQSMQNDAIAIYDSLRVHPGYVNPRLIANQAAAVEDDPTVANVRACLRTLAGHALAGDVVVFYIATHGSRREGVDQNSDEPATEEPNGRPGFQGTIGRTDEAFVLRDGRMSDDEFSARFTDFGRLRAGVNVVGLFDHCFSGGHSDGTLDLHARLGARNPHNLLMSIERQYPCFAIEPGLGFPQHLQPGNVDPYAPGPQFHAGVFTNYLRKGLALVPNVNCLNQETTRADSDGSCITTSVELFNYAADKTKSLVADDDLDDRLDEDGEDPLFANADGDAWPAANGAAETDADCRDLGDNDGDGIVNDGCGAVFPAPVGPPEGGGMCNLAGLGADNDGDGTADDGCGRRADEDDPVDLDSQGGNGEDPPEFAADQFLDNDGDGRVNEDGFSAQAHAFRRHTGAGIVGQTCPPVGGNRTECRQYPKLAR